MEFLILLGAPGAGKGTLSRVLQKQDHFLPVSTGERIRHEMADPSSSFGLRAKPYMDRGDYLPDALALELFAQLVTEYAEADRLVLDGYPRTVPQGEHFLNWCQEQGHRCLACVRLEVPVEDAVARIEQRRVCSQCRAPYHLQNRPPKLPGICDLCGGRLMLREDDDSERLQRRLQRYEELTRPLLDWFAERDLGLSLDGNQPPETLRETLMAFLSREKL